MKKDENDSLDECEFVIKELESEQYVGRWEPEFMGLYEQALLNSLWDEGLLNKEEYEWCLNELRGRSEKSR